MNTDAIILAIETSQIGSVSLMKGSELIDFWTGDKENSRSQDLLPEVSKLLDKNDIEKQEIGLIAAATGPGSFTGLRVGISIAMGISRAIGCARIGVPTLSAMALVEPENNAICVVPAGKEQCYWQAFDNSEAASKIYLSSYEELKTETVNNPIRTIISEFHLFEKLKEMFTDVTVVAAPENLAYLIGLSALTDQDSQDSRSEIIPLYVRDATVRL